MADGNNTTDFKVKVTADTNSAEQNVKDLGDETQKTDEKFKSLKSQIRETTVALQKLADEGKVGSAEFEKMRSKLDDLNDAQDRVNYQAGQFDDKLAALPGPIGQVGQALQGFNESMVKFGKSTMIALGVVGLIITAFVTMKESLESTAEGQALLNRLTTAFQKVLGPLLAIVERVAIPVFEVLATVLEKVASGLAAAAEWMGIAPSKIKEAQSGVKDFKKAADDLAKEQKEKADKAAADEKQRLEKAKAAREKAAAEAKAAREKAAAEQLEFEKAQVQAAIELLDGREKEQAALAVKYGEERLKYKNRSQKELLIFDEAYQKQRTDIDKKYEDERLGKLKKDQEDEIKALDEFYKEQEDLKRYKDFSALQTELETLEASNQARENDFQADIARNELKKQRLLQQQELEIAAEKDSKQKKMEIAKRYGDAIAAIDRENTAIARAEIQARIDLQLKYADVVGQLGSVLQQAAGDNKGLAIAGLIIEQAAGVAKIIINTQVAAAKAGYFTPLGIATLVSGALSVASAVMATTKGIQQINAVQTPGGGGSGASVGAPSIQAPRIGTAATPQMAEGVGANPSAQIAQTIGQAQERPIKAYVVSQDITSQQQLDRKTNASAVF